MVNKFIAHRGNINAIHKDRENTPSYIDTAIENGYDVEVDVRYVNDNFYLGHDSPDILINKSFLTDRRAYLWIHCKNIEALYQLTENDSFNVFSHDKDEVVLTSTGVLWTYPGKKLTSKSVCVLPETSKYTNDEISVSFGICSDYIERYKQLFQNL